MMSNPVRLLPITLVVAFALPATVAAEGPSSVALDTCVAINNDADRLACFDAATRRATRGPQQADAAAERAEARKEQREAGKPVVERAKDAFDDLFAAPKTAEEEAIANAGKGSLLDRRWELAKDSKIGLFHLSAYKPVYVLPAFWTTDTNEMPHSPNPRNTVTERQNLDSLEAKFQLSFKTKAVENLFGDNGDLWLAYTQSSRWQLYNGKTSRPFRETDYEPEVLMTFRTNYGVLGWKGRMAAIGINHQSNGRADPLSRSWNRVMFMVGFDRKDWSLMLRPWIHLGDGRNDDNPDIADYMGRMDATLVHTMDKHEFSLTLRHSLKSGVRSHGALQADWAFPVFIPRLRGHLQLFHGYGESLIDYNHKATYVGLGVSLLEWY